jgi:hypothetical protein
LYSHSVFPFDPTYDRLRILTPSDAYA